MGLADRHYMREDRRFGPLSATVIFMIVMVVVFALQCINDVYFHTRAERWLALTPECFRQGWLWQLITFQFLHAGFLHIAFNLITFWWIGRFVESVLGKKRFVVAMLGCGAAGGILQGFLMVLLPSRFGGEVVGASAGVSGLFAIFALLEKDSQVRLYFVLPVRAITLLWAFGIISLFFTVVPASGTMGIAHAAHLGGLLAGVAWVNLGWHHDYVQLPWEGWSDRWRRWQPFGSRQRKRELVRDQRA